MLNLKKAKNLFTPSHPSRAAVFCMSINPGFQLQMPCPTLVLDALPWSSASSVSALCRQDAVHACRCRVCLWPVGSAERKREATSMSYGWVATLHCPTSPANIAGDGPTAECRTWIGATSSVPKKKDNPRVRIQVQNLDCVFFKDGGSIPYFSRVSGTWFSSSC